MNIEGSEDVLSFIRRCVAQTITAFGSAFKILFEDVTTTALVTNMIRLLYI
jgi:hypothetical protein